MKVAPLRDDFTNALAPPKAVAGRPVVGFFPGSTIGNFTREEARDFLAGARRLLGEGAAFLVGIDLVKAETTLVAAYDDAQGVTADFNLNLLARINRELGGDFDLAAFAHRACGMPARAGSRCIWRASGTRPCTSAASRSSSARERRSTRRTSHKFTLGGVCRPVGGGGLDDGAAVDQP